jgi:DNA replication regulator DPB11
VAKLQRCRRNTDQAQTRYADIALQMGADHKLDLTSDTTHLIVGSTDSLKYQYVAREREDIKVLSPRWIEAVQELWMQATPFDLDALTVKHRLPTLSGLKICITGFDDLSFRAQLQQDVQENGGEYTGDLTKDVTHLIAARPEGKKYEYGIQWQKKVVSIQWYRDTRARGMQLDESLYHPTLPAHQQGVGAWNRRAQPESQLGKRTREEIVGPEPPRKLRRTASARLGSQTDSMWTDIVNVPDEESSIEERPRLKPSISMPALRSESEMRANVDARHITHDSSAHRLGALGLLEGITFAVRCFDSTKVSGLCLVPAGVAI